MVLLWHYQHFYYPQAGVSISSSEVDTQPFFRILEWFYTYGYYGVEFFWVISGLVFAHVYVSGPKLQSITFLTRRLARLYPLHLTTLLAVAALQYLSWSSFGHFQIYLVNDLHHFILNLFLASSWGLEQSSSFNAPIWSVSVEVLVYLLFIFILPVLRLGRLHQVGVTVLALVIVTWAVPGLQVAQCASYFFLGGSIYAMTSVLPRSGLPACAAMFCAIAVVTALLSPLTPIFVYLMTASAVACAVCLDFLSKSRQNAFSILGDWSYGTYLLHVPVQIVILILFDAGFLPRSIAQQDWFFLAYFASVVALAAASYHCLERPAQRAILMLEKRPEAAQT